MVNETVVVFVKGVEVAGDAGGIHKKKPGLFYNGPDRLVRLCADTSWFKPFYDGGRRVVRPLAFPVAREITPPSLPLPRSWPVPGSGG